MTDWEKIAVSTVATVCIYYDFYWISLYKNLSNLIFLSYDKIQIHKPNNLLQRAWDAFRTAYVRESHNECVKKPTIKRQSNYTYTDYINSVRFYKNLILGHTGI